SLWAGWGPGSTSALLSFLDPPRRSRPFLPKVKLIRN
ncbi:unnamed protein product, partial [Larinioides sclopetarius]